MIRIPLFLLALVLIGGGRARGSGPPELILELIAENVLRPTAVLDPDDGTGRLFFAQLTGQIRVFNGTGLLREPFLDILPQLECCGETGLLDVELHPEFAENGVFYVSYTSKKGPNGVSTISSFRVSEGDPNKADPSSERVLFEMEQPELTHNAGEIEFGPDGMLYAAFGDGGQPSYEEGVWVSQRLDTLFGKIIRIRVDPEADQPYSIPDDNPFVGRPEARGEIWALGLRNPWRFSFDRDTDEMLIGDVGSGLIEEVNLVPAGVGGLNFGWPCLEGELTTPYGAECPGATLTPPILGMPRNDDPCRSITGGFRYRGLSMPELRGRYIFADWCLGQVWAAVQSEDGWDAGEPLDIGHNISTFGEDAQGEIYIGSFEPGAIYRLRTAWPRPELSTVSPGLTVAGGQGFLMTLVGEGFVPGVRVLFDGQDVPVELIDNQRMRVAIGPEQIELPGVRLIEIRNPEPNPGPSATAAFSVETGAGLTPAIFEGGIVGAAKLSAAPLAPGQAFSVFGEELARYAEQATTSPLPTSLGGVTLRLSSGESIPLLYASPTQINAVAPWSLPVDVSLEIYVERGESRSATIQVETAVVSPGVFTVTQDGGGQAAALIAGQGVLAAPPAAAPGARPVRRGEAIEVYLTGLGGVAPGAADGLAPGPKLRVTLEKPVARVGGVPAPVLFSGLAPGFIGLYQMNVLIPDEAPVGDAVELLIAARGVSSNAVTIAVE